MSTSSLMRKVPEITIFFWIVKVLTTAFGESVSDFFVQAIDPVVAVVLGGVLFLIALGVQFWVRRYIPGIYWFTVAMVAVFGTMMADVLHIGLGIPYIATTTFFAVVLAIIFALWYAVEKTLSIHSIYTKRREVFYWTTVITTFALGTAAGDMTASTLGLGYLTSGILFGVLIVVVTIAHFVAKGTLAKEHKHQSRNAVIAFWFAYILTRPLGASFADWMGKATNFGGLGWGDGTVSLILGVLIIGFVAYMTFARKEVEKVRV